MRWRGGRRSSNVQFGGGRGLVGGGIGAVVIALVAMVMGVDPRVVLQGGGGEPTQAPPTDDPQVEFVSVVLGYTEDVWNQLLPAQLGRPYQEPQLVIFSGAVQSACGFAQAAVGPFYCPLDRKVYLDLEFFDELAQRFGAPGDFAQAYVIAHEVGHHVQTLLGISEQVRTAQRGLGEAEANDLSVRLELQADCLAGIWGYHAEQAAQILEAGDVEEALGAAAAIGDDRLQRQGQGYVVPESFTHGSSAQRVRWFRQGFSTGDLRRCDTFNAESL